jgi:hypothetical protein
MSDYSFLERPEHVKGDDDFQAWFLDIALHLLNGCRLVAGGREHRLTEVECYYHSADHPDPFPHSDPIQHDRGLWYFHKTRGEYRGGSFKGLDLTFGHGEATGGVLIRGVETPDGRLIDGPSLTVDHLLKEAGYDTVQGIDRAIRRRKAWEEGNPLQLVRLPALDAVPVYRSARVGLSLRRTWLKEGPRFVLKPYRFLTEPKRIRKGKVLLILELYQQGMSEEQIREVTGSLARSVRNAIEAMEAACDVTHFGEYSGVDLSPKALCRLHGTWRAVYGPKR